MIISPFHALVGQWWNCYFLPKRRSIAIEFMRCWNTEVQIKHEIWNPLLGRVWIEGSSSGDILVVLDGWLDSYPSALFVTYISPRTWRCFTFSQICWEGKETRKSKYLMRNYTQCNLNPIQCQMFRPNSIQFNSLFTEETTLSVCTVLFVLPFSVDISVSARG